MKKSLGLLLIGLGFIAGQAWGQLSVAPSFKTFDSITYQAYINQDWNTVLKTGNQALEHHIDYYYLRMRMGAAAYELGYLPLSVRHYEQALVFNTKDPTAEAYLYNIYLILNKKTLAFQLSSGFNDYSNSLISYKRKSMESISMGGGVSLTNNYALNENQPLLSNQGILAQQTLNGNKQFIFGGLPINLSPTIRLYMGFTHLIADKQSRNQYMEYPIQVTSTVYEDWGFRRTFSTDGEVIDKTFNSTISQNEVYVNLRAQLKNKWSFSAFGGLIFVDTDYIVSDSIRVFITDTNYFVRNTGEVDFMQYSYLETNFFKHDTTLTNYTVGIHLEKDFYTTTFGFTGIVSNLNSFNQTQLSLDAFYYIGKGVNFFGNTEGIFFYQKASYINEKRFIFRQSLGHKLYKLSWLEAEAVIGNLNNATLYQGMVVYNNMDKMNYRLGINLVALFGSHLECSLRYQYISLEGNYMEYFTVSENRTRTFAYETQNFIGGIKWTF